MMVNVSVNEIDDDGCVECPTCLNIIDPCDFSNFGYEVLEATINGKNKLTRIVVKCHVCGAEITISFKELEQ
jgi:hypothetical protein